MKLIKYLAQVFYVLVPNCFGIPGNFDYKLNCRKIPNVEFVLYLVISGHTLTGFNSKFTSTKSYKRLTSIYSSFTNYKQIKIKPYLTMIKELN